MRRIVVVTSVVAIACACGIAQGPPAGVSGGPGGVTEAPSLADYTKKGPKPILASQGTPAPDVPESSEELRRQVEALRREKRRLGLLLQQAQIERAVAARGDAPGEWASVLRNSIWPEPRIRVSWENPTSENERGRQLVRQAVEATWQRESGLEFFGWGPVTQGTSDGIRIRVADDHPHVKRLGRHLNNLRDGMVLNFTFRNWCPQCASSVGGDAAIQWIAVHEFGHALGFAHEQNRVDAPAWCREHAQGTPGDWNITVYDPESIMNYCSSEWNNRGRLSDLDVQAVRALYGNPRSGTANGPGRSQPSGGQGAPAPWPPVGQLLESVPAGQPGPPPYENMKPHPGPGGKPATPAPMPKGGPDR